MPAAIPSRTVDLPDPFSPTKNVTGVVNSSASSDATTGTVHGNPLPSCDRCRRSAERYTYASYSGSVGGVPPLRRKVRWERLGSEEAESGEAISRRVHREQRQVIRRSARRSLRGGGPRYARHGSSDARFTSATVFLRH